MARRGTQSQTSKRAPTAPAPAVPAAPPALAALPAGTAAAAAALAAAFVTLTGAFLAMACRKALVALGVSLAIIAFLALFAFSPLDVEAVLEAGPAETEQRRLAAVYRAWYILNAVDRLEKAAAKGGDALAKAEEAEAAYFRLHLRAVANRIQSAQIVDEAAARHGPLLGWKATMDNRTTLECREANGKNFRADHEPVIGYPGAVHPHCRCIPVAPFPGAPLLPSF